MADDLDLDDGGGAKPEPEKPARPARRPGRPARENVSTELKGSISGGLNELAEWLEGRDEELAATLRESAPRIADFLAVHAAKRARVARGVRYVFAKGGPFAALRAFGPLVRAIGDRLGARRQEEPGDGEPEAPGGEPGPVIPDA